MDYLLAYAAGLLTLINPCVLPVLPIVIASALQVSPRGPLVMAAGLSLSFVVLGVGVTAFGRSLGLDMDTIAQAGAAVMVLFGLAMLVPRAGTLMTAATAGLSSRADAQIDGMDQTGLQGQFLGGVLLGAVWSPCIGPTLGGAIALASQGSHLGHVTLVMTAFAAGVSTLIVGLAYGTRGALTRWNTRLRSLSGYARPALGLTFTLVGLALFFKLHHVVEIWLLGVLPGWLIDLSVSL